MECFLQADAAEPAWMPCVLAPLCHRQTSYALSDPLTRPIVLPNPILRALSQLQRYSVRYPGTRSWHVVILHAAIVVQ
ncbi:hypothetical protein E2562_008163 [Oryza meyeriana var. granulata]|uniref:Uncharacterized protein n=1 Tax=Oryza meyeriana var. granulata TaxID=110450 RepID=A0A6G1CEJ2_9ORYZ|nr:hypothetical protein E2562_008163 [Oryza meyeriana var. granulata]